ncbi:MAG: diacylglycerol/lipid kinase family protein [Thermomicrobiales bacterium]
MSEQLVIEPRTTVYKNVMVVINPATRRHPDRIAEIVARAAPAGTDIVVRQTVAGVAVKDLLGTSARQMDAVIAAGGDGTVAAVATALGDSGVPLGIIPAGSTNVIAREQGIPLNSVHAARLVFGKHTYRQLDAGICGNHRFLHMAGAGIDSRLFLATDAAAKQKRGWIAYVGPALRSLRAAPSRFSIDAEGVSLDVVSPLVLVANGTSILKPYFLTSRTIRPDDGWLDILVFTAVQPLPIARALGRFAMRSLDRSAYVTRIPTRSVRLSADPPLPIELDGDVVTQTPAQFSIAPGALRLIIPRS